MKRRWNDKCTKSLVHSFAFIADVNVVCSVVCSVGAFEVGYSRIFRRQTLSPWRRYHRSSRWMGRSASWSHESPLIDLPQSRRLVQLETRIHSWTAARVKEPDFGRNRSSQSWFLLEGTCRPKGGFESTLNLWWSDPLIVDRLTTTAGGASL